jgi:hypothetical protein
MGVDMSDLTDEAKAEIAEAVRIVREDRFEKYVRDKLGGTPPENSGTPGGPPPPKDPTDPANVPPKKAGIWWGDALDEGDGK